MPLRLDMAALGRLPRDVARPDYHRASLRHGIVHLGVGAFHRAHQALVTDMALNATGDLRWGITGVSLRSPDMRAALTPQDGLYTVCLRDAAPDGSLRQRLTVVGAILDVLVAADDPQAVLERIAHPDTRIVSLTITEKGYSHDPASGRLRLDDPDIAHDIGHAQAPRSAIGMLTHGLALRHARGLPAVTLLSCDNLPSNGNLLRGLVLAFAEQLDAGLRDWIEAHCTFPNSMVDRIVPRTTDADRDEIARRLGVYDASPVVGEPFLEWVVEDRFAAGRPEWDQPGGARFVEDAAPYERLKLRLVNGPQSTLAYLGAMAGIATNNEVVSRPVFRDFLRAMMREEIVPTLGDVPGIDFEAFAERLLVRLSNPALPHRTRQVAMDGSQKIPQRLLETVRARLEAGAGFDRLALAIAAWIHYLRGRDEAGIAYTIEDPLAGELADRLAPAETGGRLNGDDAVKAERARIAKLLAYRPVFGALGEEPAFADAVARHTLALREQGVEAAVRAAT